MKKIVINNTCGMSGCPNGGLRNGIGTSEKCR